MFIGVYFLIISIEGFIPILTRHVDTNGNDLIILLTICTFFAAMCLIGSIGKLFFRKWARFLVIVDVAFNIAIAFFLSGFTVIIQTGVDTAYSDSVGIIRYWGFPIHYCSKAPGLAWAEYDPMRFLLNSFVWFIFLMAFWFYRRKIGQKSKEARPE